MLKIALRPAAVLVGLLCLTATASAGPIPWGFQVIDGPIDHVTIDHVTIDHVTIDHVTIDRRDLGVGEYRESVLTRPVLDPNPALPDLRTHFADSYSVSDTTGVRKVRVWMGQDDAVHDQWRTALWSVFRSYRRTPDRTGWELFATSDYTWPGVDEWSRSVMEFDNGEADGLVNRVEMWNESGTLVFRMTPDVAPQVPEPATLALAMIGLGAVGLARRRK